MPTKEANTHTVTSDLAFTGPDKLSCVTADWRMWEPRAEQSEHNITSATVKYQNILQQHENTKFTIKSGAWLV